MRINYSFVSEDYSNSMCYNLLDINDCKLGIYKGFNHLKTIGIFNNKNLLLSDYAFDSNFIHYDGANIQDILKVQSLDEIQEKISEAKEIKVKKLTL